jgi:hypothetical protein
MLRDDGKRRAQRSQRTSARCQASTQAGSSTVPVIESTHVRLLSCANGPVAKGVLSILHGAETGINTELRCLIELHPDTLSEGYHL